MATFFAWFVVAEPKFIKSEPEDLMTKKAIDEMRNWISGDPYGRDTLKNIYTAMTAIG